ncbi:MAG: hypothetical protein QOE72_1156 [Chloroflexota bacterium]|jgi:hypothetical protein|nr:hypothetical protein [Chloroflexota bacterium]
MSRRHLTADEPGCTWEYGWDPQRQTFYAQLLAGEEPVQRELAHFGTRVREIGSPDLLMYLMGMRLPAERLAVLEADRLTDSDEVEARPAPRSGAPRALLTGRRDTGPVRRGAPRLGMASVSQR